MRVMGPADLTPALDNAPRILEDRFNVKLVDYLPRNFTVVRVGP